MTAQDRTKIKHQTFLSRDENGRTVVTLYKTDIVTFDEDSIILNTGGWPTATTKARMNFASNEFSLDYRVSAQKGEWQVTYNGEVYPYLSDKIKLDRKTGEVVTVE